MTEHEICKELMRWVGYNIRRYPCLALFHHVANEGKRNPRIAKSEGILAGLPDYHLPVSDGVCCGFWMEIKKTGAKPTKRQNAIMSLLRAHSNHVVWTDDLSTAISHLEEYVKTAKRNSRVSSFVSKLKKVNMVKHVGQSINSI